MKINSWVNIETIPMIRSDELLVFKIDLSRVDESVKRMNKFTLQSEDDIIRFNKYRYQKDRVVFAVARLALRFIGSRLMGRADMKLKLKFGEFGKPYFADLHRLQFNISHSQDLILLSFGLGISMGIDVEAYNPKIDHLDLARSVFSINEVEQLKALPGERTMEGFYNCWTKKEAYIKTKGKGLQIPLAEFSVRLYDDGWNNLCAVDWDDKEPGYWQLFNLDVKEQYAAACACAHHVKEARCYDVADLIGRMIL